MKANQAQFPVRTMCRLLGVSPSGYYEWRERPPSARARSDAALLERIERHHLASRCTYGSPRILTDLADEGVHVGRKRVARLMRRAGIMGVSRRRFCRTTQRDRDGQVPPDLVERQFKAAGPNELWVADITYVPTWAGFLYLAVVLDVWSRRVVGWCMATHLRTELVLTALEMAVWRRQPSGVIHHSDQGCQYTSVAFGARCREAGVRPSTGTVGDCYDNAMAESFFATLECECLDQQRFKTQKDARMVVFDYIEGFYNPHRRHSALGNVSPINYETRYTQQVA